VVVNAQPYFGLLAIGLIYFCLRYALAGWARFSETIGLAAFWLYNGGLVSGYCRIFPIGWPQLDAVYEHGFAYARSSARIPFSGGWMRFPGDVAFALGALLVAGISSSSLALCTQPCQAAPFRPACPGIISRISQSYSAPEASPMPVLVIRRNL
jgi:hypothetical protein